MEVGEILRAETPGQWRAWLEAHHQQAREIWLVIPKAAAGKRGLSLSQAVEEALCFGWIDSTLKPLDETRYALRFSPRRKQNSKRKLW